MASGTRLARLREERVSRLALGLLFANQSDPGVYSAVVDYSGRHPQLLLEAGLRMSWRNPLDQVETLLSALTALERANRLTVQIWTDALRELLLEIPAAARERAAGTLRRDDGARAGAPLKVVPRPRNSPEHPMSWDLPTTRPSGPFRPRSPHVRHPSSPARILAVCDEWLPARGGLSTLNRSLCIALADAGCQVSCVVPGASPEERDDAAAVDVTLVVSAPLPGMSERQALMRKPAAGHRDRARRGDRTRTHHGAGRQVPGADDHFPGSRRIHCVHMAPDEIEWHKLGQQDDAGTRADERSRIELALASDAALAVPIGPRLDAWLRRDLRGLDGAPPLVRLDPGFDSVDPVTRRVPDGRQQIMLMGRVNDARTKGVDLAARAVGHALRLNHPFTEWDLLVRGAAIGTPEDLHAQLLRWIGHRAADVIVRPYTTERAALRRDLLRTSLLPMPCRVEGYGLVGQEAIMAGTPVLISDRSGLGALLREVLPAELAHRVVVPVDRDDKVDVPVWGHRIAAVLLDREAAFATAAAVRDIMASERTWARATRRLIDGLAPFSV